ncbi:hypothetical protein G9H65_09465 [Cytophagaceae bacterium 50A-KIRBA]|uniref:hypothetical protein n=1 Tax=Aquirufa ecclesiirivi TaxID=2715124 RepID=UPI00140B6A87|nr:hypothetical protein [Aquirufa ecclesiirivi]NHC49562.1 hypothetical protein [Aquirufa ecclesiirivi]
MKKSKYDSTVEKTNEPMQKRAWISPEIKNWENDNLENAGGIGADGGSKAYAT